MEPQAAYVPNGFRCSVCRTALERGADKCTECGSFQGEPCRLCGQRLPRAAPGDRGPRKCTECGSYQRGWGRFFTLGNASVSSLTALLAVASLAGAILLRTTAPTGFHALGLSASENDLRVLITNRTDGPAYVLGARLSGGTLGKEPEELNLRSLANAELTEAERQLDPGVHTILLRPGSFEATGCAGRDTVFDLEVSLEPRRFWQSQTTRVSGIHRWVNAYAQMGGCTP